MEQSGLVFIRKIKRQTLVALRGRGTSLPAPLKRFKSSERRSALYIYSGNVPVYIVFAAIIVSNASRAETLRASRRQSRAPE